MNIDNSKQKNKINFLFEEVISINGNKVKRIKSSIFYSLSLFLLIVAIVLLSNKILIGAFIIITVCPILFLYPFVRFLFGGKDSLFSVISTVVLEEFIKRKISNRKKK